jgi:hypothetical protein
MTKDEELAMDLALEALEKSEPNKRKGDDDYCEIGWMEHRKAIKAIKQARALDKKAENARELGLDYEPVQEPDYKALWRQVCERCDELDKELSATDRQVEILSDALAESRREVAAPVQEPVAYEYGDDVFWHDSPDINDYIRANGKALVYATPPAQPAPVQEPVVPEGYTLVTTEGYEWAKKLAVSALAQQAIPLTELQKDATNLLFALHDAWPYVHRHCTIESKKKAIQALIVKHGEFADLHPPAAPVQEPVAWMGTDIEGNPNKFRLNPFNGGVELYKKPQSVKVWDAEGYDALMQELELWKAAAQRQWVGLTDEEITDIWAEASPYYHEDDFARAIEAKLKEKNT